MPVRGLLRSLRPCLESRIARRVPGDHAFVLAGARMPDPEHVRQGTWQEKGLAQEKGVAGEGRRDFRGRMARFAEQALYKLLAKGLLSNPEGNIGGRWKEATYLGRSPSSNSYVLGNTGGIEEARSTYRVREMERRRSCRHSCNSVCLFVFYPWTPGNFGLMRTTRDYWLASENPRESQRLLENPRDSW